ncbi:uncharacterized protein V1516DRAFT_613421, partial [Lipomyces oligophaga]|uniref:uncharacterized protein n=1 Tax=Lipomyces oligophaga TaxID=45792 RepID=UPI0034CE58C7
INWIKNGRVLLLGNEVDKTMLQFICQTMHAKHGSDKATGTAECSVPSLNFTLSYWPISSLTSSDTDWWVKSAQLDVSTLESRYRSTFESKLNEVIGRGASPDLILIQPLFLEQTIFPARKIEKRATTLAEEGIITREATIPELAAYGRKFDQVIDFLYKVFGEGTVMMYRSAIVKQPGTAEELTFIKGLDSRGRSAALHRSIEVFEWGKFVQLFPEQDQTAMHKQKSTVSFLYADMMWHYLFRALGGVDRQGTITIWPIERAISITKQKLWAECHE